MTYSADLPHAERIFAAVSSEIPISATAAATSPGVGGGLALIVARNSVNAASCISSPAFAKALIDKRGMERYGFAIPMDEAEAKVLIDFGGRNWIVWDAEFKREKIGEMPTEMFFHFFKSFSDAAKANINISCKGENEHHKIEAIFKAFAKAIKMAVKRNPASDALPSTKGVL